MLHTERHSSIGNYLFRPLDLLKSALEFWRSQEEPIASH